jgi:hypothetical protein
MPARAAVPITAEQVASALAVRGVLVEPAQVRFLAQVVATQPTPELETVIAGSLTERRAKVEMRCRERSVCLPFYVLLDWPDAASSRRAVEELGGTAGLPRPLMEARRLHAPVVVRSGETVTLVIEGQRMRLELPVVCMQNGALGARIRVVSPDHKQAYVAEVVGEKLLKVGI